MRPKARAKNPVVKSTIAPKCRFVKIGEPPPQQKIKTKEADLLRGIQDFLMLHKIDHWRVPIGPVLHQIRGKAFWKGSPLKGFPDLCGVFRRFKRGVLFAIEVKSSTGRLRPEQLRWLSRLQSAGCAVCVARSIADVEKLMRDWGEI